MIYHLNSKSLCYFIQLTHVTNRHWTLVSNSRILSVIQFLTNSGLRHYYSPARLQVPVILHTTKHGGVLLTADPAMGTTSNQSKAGSERLVRPPIETSVDDTGLREQWLAFDRLVATVLPFHGTGYIDRQASDIASIMRPLVRPEPTHWDELED